MTDLHIRGLEQDEVGSYGVYGFTPEGVPYERNAFLGAGVTGPQAEYIALISALDALINWSDNPESLGSEVQIFTTSRLLKNQVDGEWSVGDPRLRVLYREVTKQLEELGELEVKLEHVCSEELAEQDALAYDLAADAIVEQVLADPDYLDLIGRVKSSAKQKRGYERVAEVMVSHLESRNHPAIRYYGVTDRRFREKLHQCEDSRAESLLRSPHVLALIDDKPVFISTQSSYIMKDGVGNRVISADMWRSLQAWNGFGYDIYIMHKPYSNGRWKTYRDMNWSDADVEIDAQVASLGALEVEPIDAPAGWNETLRFTENSMWEDLDGWPE